MLKLLVYPFLMYTASHPFVELGSDLTAPHGGQNIEASSSLHFDRDSPAFYSNFYNNILDTDTGLPDDQLYRTREEIELFADNTPEWYNSLPLPFAADLTTQEIVEDLEYSLKSKITDLIEKGHIVSREQFEKRDDKKGWRHIKGSFSASTRFFGAMMTEKAIQKLDLKSLRVVDSILVFDSLDEITGQVHMGTEVTLNFDKVSLYQKWITKGNQAGTKQMHEEIFSLHHETGLIDILCDRKWKPRGKIDYKGNVIVGDDGFAYLVDTEIKSFELSRQVEKYSHIPRFFTDNEDYIFQDEFQKTEDIYISFKTKAKTFKIDL